MRARTAATLTRVALALACGVLACASVDDLSEEQRELAEEAYAQFLDKSFPLDESGYLSVQRYRDLPGDDPEISFTLFRDLGSGEPRIRLLMADGVPVYQQLQWLVGSAPGAQPTELLARLQVIREELTPAACPELAWIEAHWSSEWLLTTLPGRTADEQVLLHPTVVRIEVRNANRKTSLETSDDGEPAFRWASEAAERVRRCAVGAGS